MGDEDRTNDGADTTGHRPSARSLVKSAQSWLSDTFAAWSDDDYHKVAVLAPLAVEHLGKAALWHTNPVLLTPLERDAWKSLISLATSPNLNTPGLRTIGLSEVLSRAEKVLGALPIDNAKRQRMVQIRNGGMHAGTPTQSRHVLADSIAVCMAFLAHIGMSEAEFFGDNRGDARILLDEKQTEAGHQVATKRSRARRRLESLEKTLDYAAYEDLLERFEAETEDAIDPSDYGLGLFGTEQDCPECGRQARLLGRVDVDTDIEVDVENLGEGEYDYHLVSQEWVITFYPDAFVCNVCNLVLHGPEELRACNLPVISYEVGEHDLGNGFDASQMATRQHESP